MHGIPGHLRSDPSILPHRRAITGPAPFHVLYDGPPCREQAIQGWLGDGGLIATIGALADHRPQQLRTCVQIDYESERPYVVTLHQVGTPTPDQPWAYPTGETASFHIGEEFPVWSDEPHRLAYAQAKPAGWAAVLEQGLAAEDISWDAATKTAWERRWHQLIRPAENETRQATAIEKLPDDAPAPYGYARLNLGSSVWERARILAAVSGMPALVCQVPDGPHADGELLTRFTRKLDVDRPLIVQSRRLRPGERKLPYGLYPAHPYQVYEVSYERLHLHNPWNAMHPKPLHPSDFRALVDPMYATLA
jgi:hypothetical protein